ncbi:MAG: SDR family oxidoreductase [Verrucomicrobiota bacterium]
MKTTNPRIIVITGATRGLGRAMAEGFIELGHTVLGCGRSKDRIAELRKAFGKPHDFEVVDVASADEVRAWARRLLAEYGAPDLLINNAGLINTPAPLWQVPADEFSQVVDVNIKGVTWVIQSFAPAMIARKRGVIVNLSSGWGRTTDANVAPYCATKFAVEGLTQALAQELPKGMAAVALSPGMINTDMLKQGFADAADNYPSPREWSKQAVPFLLSLGPEHNGQSLNVPHVPHD